MNQSHQDKPNILHPTSRFLPLLLVLFGGSGCSALIYEIVWFQLLELVIGSSAVSLAVLLGTFMGGMCLGSILLPRIISAQRHPLRVYALLELGIGLIALGILFGLPYADGLYTSSLGPGLRGILLRGLVAAVFLLPPALLMGGTLPAIARWIETTRQGVSWLGLFYGANIGGGVFGCLLAGFYLLRVHNMAIATVSAAAVNGLAALIAFVLAEWMPNEVAKVQAAPDLNSPSADRRAVYIAIALSGMTALSAEVVWTRLLSLLLGGTVYTFALILAVFLAGLGLGSSAGSFLARTAGRPRMLLGGCQLLLTAAIAWTAYMLSQSLPYWPINPAFSTSPWIMLQLDLVRCVWALLPATLLWGASFPLALASIAAPGQDPARLVAGVYAANTLGAIVGAIGSSLLVIPWFGTQEAQRLLIILSTVAAILMLGLLSPPVGGQSMPPANRQRELPGLQCDTRQLTLPVRRWLTGRLARLAVWAMALGLPAVLAWSLPAVPGEVIAFGRYLPIWTGEQKKVLYVGEGMNSSVAVCQLENGVRSFHVSGKAEASTMPKDMRLQRMLGHLSALLHPRPRSVLVVGCGAGVTAGSFVLYPEVERIVICEIEPLIPEEVTKFFKQENYDVVHDPRVEIVYDDARHFIRTTQEKFDVITSDPIHPWVKGAAALYTKEYFELCTRHLNLGGLVTQWVPLYESDDATVKSEIATFFDAFPNGTLWSNDVNGLGYDVVLVGRPVQAPIQVDALRERLESKSHEDVARSLAEVGFPDALALLTTYGGRATDLKPWLEDAEINRDRNMRLQYLAGMGLNSNRNVAIFHDIAAYRTFPDDLFIASGQLRQALKAQIQQSSNP